MSMGILSETCSGLVALLRSSAAENIIPVRFLREDLPVMRVIIGLSLCALAPTCCAQRAAKPERAIGSALRHTAPLAPKGGIKTPGVQIPFASLKAELEFDITAAPDWVGFT